MKYYIAADGGGSKLQTILYDEELNIIGTAKTNGVNTYFKSVELIKKEIAQMLETLIPESVESLERADISVLGSSDFFIEALKKMPTEEIPCLYGGAYGTGCSGGKVRYSSSVGNRFRCSDCF